MSNTQLVTIIADKYEDQSFTTKDVAEYFNIDPRTVENWRTRGDGPRCHRNEKGRWVYAYRDIKYFVPPLDWTNAPRVTGFRKRASYHVQRTDQLGRRA